VPLVTPSAPVDTLPVVGSRHRAGDGSTSVVAHADTTGYVVFMRPPYQRALADVIEHYKWPRVFYVYDNSEGKKDCWSLVKTGPQRERD